MSMGKSVLVIGYGSIGRRHARILGELGCAVSVLTRAETADFPVFHGLPAALASNPSYVVVANATADHHATLAALADAGFAGDVLVEKPLDILLRPLPANRFAHCVVAYNLRFHPVMRAVREALGDERLLSAQIYAGQYLPDWRPETDYRSSYSASIEGGGGVLRDLSHELDYALWLCGGWRRLAALGGHLSPLDIESDDCWGMLVQTERCPVMTLQVNYLDRPGYRSLVLNTPTRTIKCELGTGVVIVDGQRREWTVGRDDSYRNQHMAALEQRWGEFSSVADALAVMEMIESAECSAKEGTWIEKKAASAPFARAVAPRA